MLKANLKIIFSFLFILWQPQARAQKNAQNRLVASVADRDSKISERLNQIFFWQISDELKLSTEQEKKMISIVELAQKKRLTALTEKEKAVDLLKKLPKEFTEKLSKPVLEKYRKALLDIASVESTEFSDLLKLLGNQTLAKFYLIREDVISKVREALEKKSVPSVENSTK